jgi:hypothetical protein
MKGYDYNEWTLALRIFVESVVRREVSGERGRSGVE